MEIKYYTAAQATNAKLPGSGYYAIGSDGTPILSSRGETRAGVETWTEENIFMEPTSSEQT